MAISIASEPKTGDLIAAYIANANDFEVDVTVSTGELPAKIKTTVYGYKIGTGTVIHTSNELQHEYNSLATLTYTFNVDVAGRLQAFFDNLNLFPTLDTYTSGVSDAYGIDYKLEATSVRATGADDTYQDVATVSSSAITSVNAYRDLSQTQNLDSYDANTTNPHSFFTSKPDGVVVDYSTNEFLLVHDANSCYRVQVQFYTGVLDTTPAATREFFITGTTVGENNTGKIGIVGIGPVNIDAVGAAGRFVSGVAVPMEANGIKKYDIIVQDSGPTQVSVQRTYYVQACNPIYRIHFVNQLGGIDSLLVSRYKNETTRFDGTNYATAKTSSNTAQESGVQVLQKVGTQGIAFKMVVTQDEMEWLRQLALSPAVRLEKDGAYISIVVTKAEFTPDDDLGQTYTLDFEAEYSNRIEGLRN